MATTEHNFDSGCYVQIWSWPWIVYSPWISITTRKLFCGHWMVTSAWLPSLDPLWLGTEGCALCWWGHCPAWQRALAQIKLTAYRVSLVRVKLAGLGRWLFPSIYHMRDLSWSTAPPYMKDTDIVESVQQSSSKVVKRLQHTMYDMALVNL